MAMNLVEIIKGQFGPQVLDVVGKSLGQSGGQTQGALGAAIPAILAGLATTAAKPEGAQKLAATLGQQDLSILGNVGGALGGPDQTQLVSKGNGTLESLVGEGGLAALVAALGKFTGLSGVSAASLLGMVAPVVMGVLSREQKTGGLDAGGIASMLAGQQQNIASAMPQGLGSILSGSGLLDGLGDTAKAAFAGVGDTISGAAGTVQSAAAGVAGATQSAAAGAIGAARSAAGGVPRPTIAPVASATRAAVDTVRGNAASTGAAAATGGNSWLKPVALLVVALAIIWAGYHFLVQVPAAQQAADAAKAAAEQAAATAKSAADQAAAAAKTAADQATEAAESAASSATMAAGDLTVGGVDLGGQLNGFFTTLGTTVGGITDPEGAKAALPKLDEVKTGLDGMTATVGQLPATGKTALAALIASSRPTIQATIDKVNAIPGVSDLVKPALDAINAKLDEFAKA